jgi:hypothetical protein
MIQITLNIDMNAARKEVLNLINAKLPVKGRRGKSDSADYAKALSARRLMNHFHGYEKALEHIRTDNGDKSLVPTYINREQWWRASSDARENVASVLDRLI